MGSPSFEGQGSNEVPSYHDDPPEYDSKPDQLTSVIENVHDERILGSQLVEILEKLEAYEKVKDLNDEELDYSVKAEIFFTVSTFLAEGAEIGTNLANLYKERAGQNHGLHLALSKLTDSEFDQTYASLGRGTRAIGQSLKTHDTVNISKGRWKRFWKNLGSS